MTVLRLWAAGALALLLIGSAAADADAPQIPLRRHLRMLIRPTLLGLVPPADPEGYGEAFVRVLRVEGDALAARYEIKEQTTDADGEALTRIRHGQIEVGGLTAGASIAPPLFWPDGDFQSDGGLLWLPRILYDALLADGAAPLRVELVDDGEDAAQAYREQLERLDAAEQSVGAGQQLELIDPAARYSCWVNGERLSLPALRAVDSLQVAEYWILADRANPLMLKMSLLPPELEPGTDPEGLGLVEAGAGYAIVEINY